MDVLPMMLGDYSMDSDDSRFKPSEIVGRPWLIVAPAARRRFVNP
jgi:hypothetical protein